MMSNLFSMFDPGSCLFSMSWSMFLLSFLFIQLPLWKFSPLMKLTVKIMNTFKSEVKFTLGNSLKSAEQLIILLFCMVLLMNFLALYPHIFSLTSHLAVTLPLALTCWLSLFIFGWTNFTQNSLSHLVPQGTPSLLMPFMVLIELISSLIRPITLCVRLTANLIAGHLLMTLLGNFLLSNSVLVSSSLMIVPIMLTVLESAVACIQAYVFMTLITLYMTEAN